MTASATMVRRPAVALSRAVDRAGLLVMVMSISLVPNGETGIGACAELRLGVITTGSFRCNPESPLPFQGTPWGVKSPRARWNPETGVGIGVALGGASPGSRRLLVREGRADLATFSPASWVLIV